MIAVSDETSDAAQLRRALAGRSDEIEAAGRLPDDVAVALKRTGVFQRWLPRELGGDEAEPAAVLDELEALSAIDGSLGWCAAIGLGTNLIGGYLPRAGAAEVFAAGGEVLGGSLRPGGRAVRDADGNLVVDGRWPFASGVHHCDWMAGVALEDTDDGPRAQLVVMPRGDIGILDTWHVAGLKGTGSTDFEAHGAMVPPSRTVPLTALQSWPAGSMWRIPLYALLLPIMAAVPLGIARAALAELTGLATAKTPFRSSRTLADRDTTQSVVGRATATVDAASAYLATTMTALFDTARSGTVPTLAQRGAARLAAVHATQGAAGCSPGAQPIASVPAVPSRPIVPADIAPPAAHYAHAVLVTGAQRWLHTSGVVPVRPDGTVPADVAVQAEVVWHNLAAMLRAAEMDFGAVVSVTTYVVSTVAGTDLAAVMGARDVALGGRRVASTLVTVAALAQPAWLVEIALIAAG